MRRETLLKLPAVITMIFCLVVLTACQERASNTSPNQVVPGGDPERGVAAIQAYGCGTCHTIPGVPGAIATVGPPLDDWADRKYIAGSLSNDAENLLFWIRFPQSVEPGTAMPDMGVTGQDANDIAAYLYTLRRD